MYSNVTLFYITDILPTALDHSSGTATNSINSNYFPNPEWIDEPRPASRYPYTYPYFLFPPSHKIPLALASHRPATSDSNAHYIAPALYNHTSNSFSGHGYEHELDESTNTHNKHFNHSNLMHKFQHNKHNVKQTTDNVRHFNDINSNNGLNNAHQHHHHQNNNNNNDGDGHNNNNHSITASDHSDVHQQHHINQHDLRKLQLELGKL